MGFIDLQNRWLENYKIVPQVLEDVKSIKSAATAFNTNVDAVIKISGEKLSNFMKEHNLSADCLKNSKSKLDNSEDVIRGIFKCFSKGIAEEWLAEDISVYNWMVDNIGYDRLQMGGQGGIVANILGVVGVDKVYVHTNSLPKTQAEQFVKLDNILSFDEKGAEKPAYKIDRESDIPLIHWIIEFDKGDSFEIDGKTITCPKSNRFIATYDPLNIKLDRDINFTRHLEESKTNIIVLSGFHALTESKDGLKLIDEVVPEIKKWKNKDILHLEIASTQDVIVRKSIVDNVAIIADSIGVNERETIDVLEVINEDHLAKKCNEETSSSNLFDGIFAIKNHIKCARIQLHMYGLYITIQDKGFKVSPEENLRGMMLAATIAASKAGTGSVDKEENLLWSHGKEVSDVGLKELYNLSEHINNKEILNNGICEFMGLDIIAIPTILVDKPKTLVGMGDTISSVSLLGKKYI